MKKNNKNTLLSVEISRRDFVNGALVGTTSRSTLLR